MKFQFVNELLTGVKEMDQQHMVLVELLNEITSLLGRDEREKAMKVFKDKLVEYVETHLKDEEEFMEKIGYPDLDNHRKVHDTFRKVIYDLLPHVEAGDVKAFREALALSWGWLYNHIARTDKKYGLYAKQKGIV